MLGALSLLVATAGGLSAPVVDYCDPFSAPVAGGTPVVVFGSGFRPGATVTIDGELADDIVVVNAGRIECTAPSIEAGQPDGFHVVVAVVVTNPGGRDSGASGDEEFVFFTPPVVVSIAPTTGDVAGGTHVVITLSDAEVVDPTYYASAASVGGLALDNFVAATNTTLEGDTQAHAAGAVDVDATNPGGTSAPLVGGFTYGVEPVFAVDFSELPDGGTSDSDFLAATGLTYARSTSSDTVQVSSSALVTGIAADYARVGSRDGAKRGLVIQPRTANSLSGTTSPRDLTNAWSAGSSVVVTYPYADSPGDSGTGCSRANVSSGGFSPFGDLGSSSARRCYSSWQRSKDAGVNGGMQQVWIAAAPGDGVQVVRAASDTWARLALPSAGATLQYIACSDGRNFTGSGGESARARDILVDFQMLQRGDNATEAIPSAATAMGADWLRRANNDGEWLTSGRTKLYFRFYPKHDFATRVSFEGSVTSGEVSHYWLAAWLNGSAQVGSLRISATTGVVDVSNDGSTVATSSSGITWSALDDVEIYVEAGHNVASVCKYRLNGGAWTDLTLGTLATDIDIDGDLYFCGKGTSGPMSETGDSGHPLVWLHEFKAYGAEGLSV